MDGVMNGTDTGIAGVTVTLDATTPQVTDGSGHYQFALVPQGAHMLVETDPPAHYSTSPNNVGFTVVSGSSHIIDFGDRMPEPPKVGQSPVDRGAEVHR
jgi:hypothetical protein